MNIIVIALVIKALKHGIDGKTNIVAYVDDKPIYRQEVQYRLNAFLANNNIEEEIKLEQFPENFLKAVVLEVFVSHKLDKLAKKENYDKDKEIRELVKNYRNRLMREKFIKDKIISNVDEEAIRKRYAELSASLQGKEERKVKHILVKDQEEAMRVRRSILRTGNFERVASQKSIDKSTAGNGGDLGYILKEEMVPEFGEVAFLLRKGELSKPVQTQFGWHILKVEDIREAKPLPFEQVKDDIKNHLQQEALQNYLKDLTDDVKIELMIKTDNMLNQQPSSEHLEEDIEEDSEEELEENMEEDMEEEDKQGDSGKNNDAKKDTENEVSQNSK